MTSNQFKQARQSLGLTQPKMAAMLGLSRIGSVSEIERGLTVVTPMAERLIRAYLSGYRPDDWPAEQTVKES